MIFAFPTPMPRAGLLGLLLAIGMIWGGTFGLARTGGDAGIPALGYGFWFAFGVGAGLLALGARDPARFQPGSGSDALIFLAQALALVLAGWMGR